MALLGIKKVWLPTDGTTGNQSDNQILKNTGYVNIQIHCVNYMSKGNFWQNTFGGSDTITLVTTIEYQSQTEKITAASVQNVRTVKANDSGNIGLQKNLALKVPANCDGIAIEVKLIALQNDKLQAKFDMLNTSEFQTALQLVPGVVGQIFSITALVKKLFSDPSANAKMEVSHAGIISAAKDVNPVSKGKLTAGMLILISTNDGNPFTNIDESKFQLKADVLYYDGKPVENTYVIFNISFESARGPDENSVWFKKFSAALDNLDKIVTAESDQYEKIYRDSLDTWIEGNALLSEDPSFIKDEKLKIKAAALKTITDRYRELVPPTPPPPPVGEEKEKSTSPLDPVSFPFKISGISLPDDGSSSINIFKSLTGTTEYINVESALPSYSKMIRTRFPKIKINPLLPLNYEALIDGSFTKADAVEMIALDANIYLKELKEKGLNFRLSTKKGPSKPGTGPGLQK